MATLFETKGVVVFLGAAGQRHRVRGGVCESGIGTGTGIHGRF